MNLYPRLSRVMTKGRDYVPQIDGLRFLAIMGVIAYHVRGIITYHYGVSVYDFSSDSPAESEGLVNWTFAAGCKGVELFFTISGFILGLPFARRFLGQTEPVSLRSYYLRRLTRLEPPYLIHLLFVFLLTALVLRHSPSHPDLYHQPDWFAHLLRHFGVSLFYGSGLVYHAYPTLNMVLWSLEIEVQFYLLAPWLALFFKIKPVLARRFVFMGLILLPIWLGPLMNMFPWLGWTLLDKLQFFMAGFLLCDLYLTGYMKTERRDHFWDLLFVGAISLVICLSHFSLVNVPLPWLTLLVCVAAFRGKTFHWLLGHPLLTTIGGMCYTIYMYHWLMISRMTPLTIKCATHIFWLDLLIQFVVMSAIIIVTCGVLFALFERPFMKRDWPKRFWALITCKKNGEQ